MKTDREIINEILDEIENGDFGWKMILSITGIELFLWSLFIFLAWFFSTR